MKRLFNFIALGCVSASMMAADFNFSYTDSNAELYGIGFNKEETYDVAVKLDNVSLTGFSIKGIRIPVPGGEAIVNPSAWMSSSLELKRVNGKYVNAPDITVQDAVIKDGVLEVAFSEPYKIDGPVYVGYSFTVESLDETTSLPVIVSEGVNTDGLYIHTSRSKMKWGEYSEQSNSVSAMTIMIDGELKENSAAFRKPSALFGSAEEETVISVILENHGSNPISSIGYSFDCDGTKGEGTATFESPVKAGWGASVPVEINLGQITSLGNNNLTLSVTSVNGKTNSDPAPSVQGDVKIYPFIPVYRPLVEEYTGLWCGWCPQGYVAMETMREQYPDLFVGLVYHSGDAMSCNFKFPMSPSGFPAAFINRGPDIDASDIYTIWPKMIDDFTPASIEVDVEWTDDSWSAIKATSTVKFIEDMRKADYSISYALLIDGISDPKWKQTNYYAPKDGEDPVDNPDMPGELGHMFTHGTNPMTGLVFNDVVINIPKVDGYQGSIPSEIVAGETITHSVTLNLSDVIDREKSQNIIQKKGNLRVVAIIIDNKTGKPINCISSISMSDSSGIQTVCDNDLTVKNTIWYDLQGNRVSNPAKGIFVKVEMMSDGSRRVGKEVK